MRGKQTKVACCALWLLFCCSATPSFVNLPLFCEFEQLGSNSLPIVTKEFVRRGAGEWWLPQNVAKCRSLANITEIWAKSSCWREIWPLRAVSAFSHTDKILTWEKIATAVIQLLHAWTLLTSCMIQWLRAYMRIFFSSIFGSKVNYAGTRAYENLKLVQKKTKGIKTKFIHPRVLQLPI